MLSLDCLTRLGALRKEIMAFISCTGQRCRKIIETKDNRQYCQKYNDSQCVLIIVVAFVFGTQSKTRNNGLLLFRIKHVTVVE